MMMWLCLTISWVYGVAILSVLQFCVHDRTCDATVSDSFLGVQYCHTLCCSFVFMIEHVVPLCLSVSWVYSVAVLCVLQVCVHDRTCDAAVSDNFLGVQCCHAGAKHCL